MTLHPASAAARPAAPWAPPASRHNFFCGTNPFSPLRLRPRSATMRGVVECG